MQEPYRVWKLIYLIDIIIFLIFCVFFWILILKEKPYIFDSHKYEHTYFVILSATFGCMVFSTQGMGINILNGDRSVGREKKVGAFM